VFRRLVGRWELDRAASTKGKRVSHLNGISWHRASRPFPLLHRQCHPQTREEFSGKRVREICPCGKVREGSGQWKRTPETLDPYEPPTQRVGR
jgi:hypothetical protein